MLPSFIFIIKFGGEFLMDKYTPNLGSSIFSNVVLA